MFSTPLFAAYDTYDPYDNPTSGDSAYVRTLEGEAQLAPAEGGAEELVQNQPLIPGDRLRIDRGSRVELVLADGSLLRLAGGTDIELQGLAGSYGTQTEQTQLYLADGTLQLVVDRTAQDGELPRIETPNATIHLHEPGRYLVATADGEWTQVLVRSGYAEVNTERGSVVVREDEQGLVEGRQWPRAAVEPAAARSDLERWGDRLEEEARLARYDGVDESLRYRSSSLDRYGSWVDVDHRRAWRPYADESWRPYSQGSWRYTPGGYNWVSYEPWGWVPYHYGSWDYVPRYGWVWFPGRTYAPAWVYWYWGPEYVGWCPTGYYSRHYGRHYGDRSRHGFRFGVYGWAGGDWGLFADWSFVPSHHFGRHGDARRTRPSYVGREGFGRGRLADGVITTDTRGLEPRLVEKPAEVVRVLRTRVRDNAELPNVTDFVARRELKPEVERQVIETKPRPVAAPTVSEPELVRRPARTRTEVTSGEGRERGVKEPSATAPTVSEPVMIRRPGRPSSEGSQGNGRGREVKEPAASAPTVSEPVIIRRPARPETGRESTKPETVRSAEPRIERRPATSAPVPRRVEPQHSEKPQWESRPATRQPVARQPVTRQPVSSPTPSSPPVVRRAPERQVQPAPPPSPRREAGSSGPSLSPKPSPPAHAPAKPAPSAKEESGSGGGEKKATSARPRPPRPPKSDGR